MASRTDGSWFVIASHGAGASRGAGRRLRSGSREPGAAAFWTALERREVSGVACGSTVGSWLLSRGGHTRKIWAKIASF